VLYAASFCSIITVEPKFSEICYFSLAGPWPCTTRTFSSLPYDSVC